MRFVPGNDDAYQFRSRGVNAELAQLSAFGVGSFNTKAEISFEPAEIPGFYLDEFEVTRREFLAFVEADSGYRALVPKAEQRIAEVVQASRLRAEGDLPVTNVTWAEASAYAAWVGKRLPSWVEWEYALRTGSYRVHAGGSRKVGPDVVRYKSNAAWSRGGGSDISEHGVRDLSGNVREWTCTPSSRADGAGRWTADKGALLAPWNRPEPLEAGEFMIVGGSFATAGYYFFTVEPLGRSQTRDDLGFRCAAPVSTIEDALEGSGLERVYVEIPSDSR
jgi:formylglycine-generating enzyme required for sulfatase activity